MIIEKGQFQITNAKGEIIETESLGSCVALVARDPEARVYGLWVFVLPAERILPRRVPGTTPEFFASEGIDKFLEALEEAGALRERLEFFAAGGARFLEAPTIFDLGGVNSSMIRKLLKDRNLSLKAERCGLPFPCRVKIDPKNDEIIYKISGEEEEKW
ncbi:CheD [Thermodesulfatator indicus DSM 15286]|uniref:CheD n=1 Tax=Thermodesulfatator indicus (strain DSM 15286 / JCM 11887 / CIR29812) TaxID=667014 RepID=F8AB99_THEID|nr:chemotaxis protein CheD [Thermodesulfatator indicus]AEH45557.1 CheD [Thermodesulfatator indicus DSM 15286]